MPKAPALKRQNVTLGANQSEHVVRIDYPGKYVPPDKDILDSAYAHCVLRHPRPYAGEEEAQILRHLSTAIKVHLDNDGVTGYQEIQAGVDKDGNIIVSSNTNAANKALREIFSKTPTLEKFRKSMQGAKPVKAGNRIVHEATEKREERHLAKFVVPARLQRIFKGATKISVAEDVKNMDGLHAERRIALSGGKRMRGIKRPCANCFTALGMKSADGVGEGPGPEWPNGPAGLGGVKPSELKTRVTVTRWKNKKTVAYDTESDSDADSAPPPRGAKRGTSALASSSKRRRTSTLAAAESDSDSDV